MCYVLFYYTQIIYPLLRELILLCWGNLLLVPDDDPPDQDHGRHGPQGDPPCEQEVGAGESGQGGGVHQGVQRPGEERGEGRHQGQAGEDPTHLGQVNTLTERRFRDIPTFYNL